ncbi:RNA pyrophosphohydrolase [Microvirga sp. W0021]|uniref:RNA pyrophosphohydrolase n=1 Tax=Hohaiivirga grylli TaxID=3133970 RepID=A0ABV0BEM6_9HYPH
MKLLSYRPCVGIMLLNAKGLVFVGRRKSDASVLSGSPYAWQMPQGGIDPGEEPYHAALRELYEETNVRSVKLVAESEEWYSYDLPKEMVGNWRRPNWRFKGQTQRWFAFRFNGDESEINIKSPAEGKHRPEFDEWRWESIERLPELIIPFKREVYEQVVKEFASLPDLVRDK